LRQFVEIADPLGDSDVGGFDSARRIIGHAVEHDQPGYLFRKRAGIGQADHAAHGVANVPVVVVEPASAFIRRWLRKEPSRDRVLCVARSRCGVSAPSGNAPSRRARLDRRAKPATRRG
jgi:hypothetical protein